MTARTTITADPHDLETVREEADRLGLSMAQMIRSVLADKAAELRAARRPRFGLGDSGTTADDVGLSEQSVVDEEAPLRTPYR